MRQDIINDIENKYFAGRELPIRCNIPKNKDLSEGFHENSEFNSMKHNIEELERKNHILIMFIFLLSLIILSQYRTSDKFQYLLMQPQPQSSNTPPQPQSSNTPPQNPAF